MTEDQIVALIAQEVVARIRAEPESGRKLVPVNSSARHIHLSPAHVERLFGPQHGLTKLKDLMQPGQFACHQTVKVIGLKGEFPQVRVLGPTRGETQLELSLTDARHLGMAIPVRLSGHIEGTPGIKLQGPRGQVTLPSGVIVAARHIHLGRADAERFGLVQGQRVRVRTLGLRPLTFDDVLIRVSDSFVPEMHIDTDEANAAAVSDGDMVEILD